jgi:hypothetical protein
MRRAADALRREVGEFADRKPCAPGIEIKVHADSL